MKLNWEDVYDRLSSIPRGYLWGVPRGGAVLAGLTGRAVDKPEDADIIIDDVCNSGRTLARYAEKYGKPVWVLVKKGTRRKDIPFAIGVQDNDWVTFPWEASDPLKDNEDLVVRLIEVLGQNPSDADFIETPRRFLSMMKELTSGYSEKPEEILKLFKDDCDEMIIVKDIPFTSLCSHHLATFSGTVTLGYIPSGKIVGLSKIPRLISAFSRRLQVQERLTRQVCHAFNSHVNPLGVGVMIRGTHSCMTVRGIKSHGEMVTSCLLGIFRKKREVRDEFLRLAGV